MKDPDGDYESRDANGWEESRRTAMISQERDQERWTHGYTHHTATALRQRTLAVLSRMNGGGIH